MNGPARAADESGKKARGQYLLARQIVAYVFEQKLDRGHHLVETGLAERIAVSRTLIRGTLKRLASKSIVEPRPNQGFFPAQSLAPTCGRVIAFPPTTQDGLYCRIVRDRISGRITERTTQVALLDRYDADHGALLRVLETMSDEGTVRMNKGHG